MMIRKFLGPATPILLAVTILFAACKKEESRPSISESTTSISSICLGEWRADSSFIISSSVYQVHTAGFVTFNTNGTMSMVRSNGSTENLSFEVGDELVNSQPGEYGRVLLWLEDPQDPSDEPWGAALLVFQSPTECNMMFTDDIAATSPGNNSLATINEYVIIDNDPVFDIWSKCYRQ